MNYPTSMTDEQLIQFYLNGDPNAMATLVELYKDRIYRSVYNMTQDKHVSEEIFQDVFIKIINNMIAGKPAEEGNFLQWATRIAQGLCIEYSRKNKLAAILNATEDNAIHTSGPAVLSNSGYHESHGRIKSLINMLPDAQREVMVLNHYGDLSFKEIAELMKCSLNTALDSMRVGLNSLRKMMMEKEIVLS
ncbi:MAG: sigma-70 family RNA polymerase sigma factor [Ferruginibacter sp.]